MIVAGNWKMHTDAQSAAALAEQVAGRSAQEAGHVQVVLAPPFPFLAEAVKRARAADQGNGRQRVIIAAQNCHGEEQGAYTGEVGVPMLRSIGVGACIVGHSERRQYYAETDAAVGRKVVRLLEHGLMPIYCCGEGREDREAGRHREVVALQLRTALGAIPGHGLAKVVVAYEPVWAIGTGLTATPAQAQEMHAFIRAELRAFAGEAATDIPILYGGSCKPDNAAGIFACPDINGGLIGGASLAADPFMELVRMARQAQSPA